MMLGLSGLPARPQQVFRGGIDVVSVNVSVQDRTRFVAGLRAADFAVTDNGVPQSIDALSNESAPLDVTLVVDVSSEALFHKRIEEFRGDIQRIGALLKPGDRLQVLADATQVTEIVPLQSVNAAWTLAALPAGGAMSSIDATAFALMQPADATRRRLVIVFTEALAGFSVLRLGDLSAIAKRTDALLEVVTSKTWTSGHIGRGRYVVPVTAQAFIDAARSTGGDVRELGRGVVDDVKDLLTSFSQSYVLRYTPKGVTLAGWHELNVRVTAAGGNRHLVRARRGYFAN